jgi:hypothetical protein
VRDGRVEAAGEVAGEAGGDASPRGERHEGLVGWVAALGGEVRPGSKTTAGGRSATWAFGPQVLWTFPYAELGFT